MSKSDPKPIRLLSSLQSPATSSSIPEDEVTPWSESEDDDECVTRSTSHGTASRFFRYFVHQLKLRMKGEPIHTPLGVPKIEIEFSNDPHKRLQQHLHHENSNYLVNLAEAVSALEHPDSFRLRQNIVFSCFQSIHTWSSEIVATQLAQGYVQGGGGFIRISLYNPGARKSKLKTH